MRPERELPKVLRFAIESPQDFLQGSMWGREQSMVTMMWSEDENS